MKRRLFCVVALVAILATLTIRDSSGVGGRLTSFDAAFTQRLAATELPQGFVLPSSDVDLNVSSLVAADVDADGDLDIVASDTSHGSVGIVVWVNDGAGRLTRQRPARPTSLGSEPAPPSLDRHQTGGVVSVQPNSPAIEMIGANAWLTLPARPCAPPITPLETSVHSSRLRSRSPPLLS